MTATCRNRSSKRLYSSNLDRHECTAMGFVEGLFSFPLRKQLNADLYKCGGFFVFFFWQIAYTPLQPKYLLLYLQIEKTIKSEADSPGRSLEHFAPGTLF